MMTIFRRAIFAAMLCPAAASAGGFQDLDAVDATATQAADGAIRPVDRRLRLAACPDILVADPPALDSVTVRCPALGLAPAGIDRLQ